FSVGLIAEQSAVGAHDRRGAGGAGAGAVDRRDVASVFGGSAQYGFFVEVGMEDDLRTAPGGPADGFRITPAFMADGDAEGQRTRIEDLAATAGRIGALFGRIDLNFVLEPG